MRKDPVSLRVTYLVFWVEVNVLQRQLVCMRDWVERLSWEWTINRTMQPFGCVRDRSWWPECVLEDEGIFRGLFSLGALLDRRPRLVIGAEFCEV